MTMRNDTKTSDTSSRRDDFKTQWQRRQQWEERAEKSAPDDQTLLQWAAKAQQTPSDSQEAHVVHFPSRRNKRWIPYAAAASIAIGVTLIGLTHPNQPDDGLPTAKEVTVESRTIHFLCNNDCSAQDIMLLANKVIK